MNAALEGTILIRRGYFLDGDTYKMQLTSGEGGALIIGWDLFESRH